MTFLSRLSIAQAPRLVLVAALATGVLGTVAGRGTLAYFTTQVTSNTNTFTAGTLHLKVADVNEAASTTSVSSSIAFSNMKPGDTVYAPIELDNNSSLDMKYGVKYSTAVVAGGNQDLAPGLKLAIRATGATGSGTKATVTGDAAHACSATNWATPGTIWPDSVYASTAMIAGTAQAGQTLVTPASAPAASGRDLAALTGKDTLCLEITFPSPAADNTYNNVNNGETNTIVTFTFDGLVAAAAVTNNP